MASTTETIQVSFLLETSIYYDRSFKCYDWNIKVQHPNFHLIQRVLHPREGAPLKLNGSADTKKLAQEALDETLSKLKAALPLYPESV